MSAMQAVCPSGVLAVHADQCDAGLVGCHFDYPDAADHHQQHDSVPDVPGDGDCPKSSGWRRVTEDSTGIGQSRGCSVEIPYVRRDRRMPLLPHSSKRHRTGKLPVLSGDFVDYDE